MYLTKNMHVRFLQTGVLVLLAMNSMLTNQQYILNKVSLNRKTHKRRLDVDQLVETMWPEAHRNLTPKNHNSVYAKFSFRVNFIDPKCHSKYEIYENWLYLIFLVAVVNEVFSINISSNWSLLVCMKTVLVFIQFDFHTETVWFLYIKFLSCHLTKCFLFQLVSILSLILSGFSGIFSFHVKI